MDRIKVTLSRKIGPFSVGVWLFVIVAGIGLGLAMRRGFGRSNEDTSGSVPDQGTGTDSEGFTPGSGIGGQGNAPVTITRTELVDTFDREVRDDLFKRLEDIETGIIEERERQAKVGTDPIPVPLPMPKPTPAPKTPAPSTPAPTGQKYTVVKGDTLWIIARKFGFTHWSPIYAANRAVIGSNPDQIKPGQVLVIPAK
jgi:hypothetical protein